MNNNSGKILKELRNSKGITLQEIQTKYGHNAGWISQIENNQIKPRPKTIKILAELYGVDYVELYNKVMKGE